MIAQEAEQQWADEAFADAMAKSILTMRRWTSDGQWTVVEFHFYQAGAWPKNELCYFRHVVRPDDPPLPARMEIYSKTRHPRVLRVGAGGQDGKLRTVPALAPQTWGASTKQTLELLVMPRNLPGAAAEGIRFEVDFHTPIAPFDFDGLWEYQGISVPLLKLPNPSNPSGPPTIIVPKD